MKKVIALIMVGLVVALTGCANNMDAKWSDRSDHGDRDDNKGEHSASGHRGGAHQGGGGKSVGKH